MKNSILILGITLVSLTNVCNASNTFQKQIDADCLVVTSNYFNEVEPSNIEVTNAKPVLNVEAEAFNPETVIAYNSVKPINEVIAEHNKITENTTSDETDFMVYEQSMAAIIAQSDLVIENTVSNEVYPLSFERSIEDEITELETIIDSSISNETSPLDFNVIDKNTKMQINMDSKNFVGMN